MDVTKSHQDQMREWLERRIRSLESSGHHRWNEAIKELRSALDFVEDMAPEGKSRWPDPDVQLRSTLVVMKADGVGSPLPEAEKHRVIHALIDQLDGAQDHAMGTVVIPAPLHNCGLDDVVCQLWIHEWE